MNTNCDPQLIKTLQTALGKTGCLTDPAVCLTYGYDNSKRQGPVLAVTFPRSHEQVVAIVKACYDFNTPLVCRGRGTGTPGGSVPTVPSIILSTEHMHQVGEVDVANRMLRAEVGATNADIQARAQAAGFFWAPDPGSAAFCSLGGNLGNNAAGPRAIKYGTTRENTLQLKAVTGTGQTIECGTLTTKGVVGYDLTRLLIGSEGTLGVITEASLLLTPMPQAKRTLRAFYRCVSAATEAVTALVQHPIRPCAVEFVDRNALELVRTHLSTLAIPDTAQAMLMIEVDGPSCAIEAMTEQIRIVADNHAAVGVEVAHDPSTAQSLWAVRRALSPTLRHVAPKKINEDVVVPVAELPNLVAEIERLATDYDLTIVSFGHAGNGNLHVNIMIDPNNQRQVDAAKTCLSELFSRVLAMRGTLSGEHGVGLDKRAFVSEEIPTSSLNLMRAIKQLFDPKGILNPGKIFPDPPSLKN